MKSDSLEVIMMEIIDNKALILEHTLNGKKPVHFIGLGGIGMSGLARFLLKLGFKVSGSDIKDGTNLLSISEMGGTVFIGHDAKNIGDAGLLVVSSAINNSNPEIKLAKEKNIPIIHRSQLLEALMSGLGLPEWNEQVTIGVSGTHGKTSTSGMIGLIYEHAGLNPSIVVGGKLPELMTNAKCGNGSYFVSELDESDGTIAIYNPNVTIINNLETDHIDHYEDGMKQLLDTFKGYVSRLNPENTLIVNIDDAGNRALLDEIQHENIILYSSDSSNEYHSKAKYKADNIVMKGFDSTADIYRDNALLGQLRLKVPGAHNISNALAALAAALENGVSFETAVASLAKFTGMKRRFQLLDVVGGIKIIDDYAHHPTEVEATLKSAKNIVKAGLANRVIAIFQPHRHSRLAGLWTDFTECFSHADKVFITDVYSAGENPLENYSAKRFSQEVNAQQAVYSPGSLESVMSQVSPELKSGDIVLTIGAGSITKLGNLLLEKLQ